MLREALASVEEARNANVLEVIIVDDGSSEAETTRILNEVAEAATASCLSLTVVPVHQGRPQWPRDRRLYFQ